MTEYYLMDMVKNDELNDQQREDWDENLWLRRMDGFDGWCPSIIAVAEEHHVLFHNDDVGTEPTPFRILLSAESREDALKQFEHILYDMPLVMSFIHGGIPDGYTAYAGHVSAWMVWNGEHGYDGESFRKSYIEDHKLEVRLDYLHVDDGWKIRFERTGAAPHNTFNSDTERWEKTPDPRYTPTWCPNCLHHGLGNTADGDHIACSVCGYVEEVKE